MVRALILPFMVSALALLHTASAFTTIGNFNTNGINCSTPAIWSGVARRPTTPAPLTTAAPKATTVPPTTWHPDTPTPSEIGQPASTTAGAPHVYNTPTSASGVWVAYICNGGSVFVYDVLAKRHLWNKNLPSSGQPFPPRFGPDGSVYATSNAAVVKFDLLTGDKLWNRPGTYEGAAQTAADVVVVPVPNGAVNFLNATTGNFMTTVTLSNPVTSGKYVAGLRDDTMQLYLSGHSAISFSQLQGPIAGYGDVICASNEHPSTGLSCVNTKKAPSNTYRVSLTTTLPFAMAGDAGTVVGIDSSGTARRCVYSCWPISSSYTFSDGISAPHFPVPQNATSSVFFGAATQNGNNVLVGIGFGGNLEWTQLFSPPVGLPAAFLNDETRTMFVAITASNNMIYVFTAEQ